MQSFPKQILAKSSSSFLKSAKKNPDVAERNRVRDNFESVDHQCLASGHKIVVYTALYGRMDFGTKDSSRQY